MSGSAARFVVGERYRATISGGFAVRYVRPRRFTGAGAALVHALLLPMMAGLLGCGPSHRLADYDFRGATVAIVAIPAPGPEVFSDLDLGFDRNDVIGSAIRVGTGIAREASIQDFRAKVDTAATNVDVPERIAERTLEATSRYLRATPTASSSEVDFEFELRIDTYGFVADDWDSRAYLALEGDLVLLDGASGRVVWSTHVEATNPVQSTSVFSNVPGLGNVVTAISLSRMSRQEIERQLEELADVTADALVSQFGEDLDESRER